MPSLRFIAKTTISNGRALTKKNAPRIVARSTTPTDRSGNRLPSPIFRYRDDPPYFRTWKLRRDVAGWIFIEVSNGSGISGHHPTVRAAVISAARFAYIVVNLED